MHTNELTFNELSAGDSISNSWGNIDISGYALAREDDEVCFKLTTWSLQCKYAALVQVYINYISFGLATQCMLDNLINFKRGLEVLNRYDPRDITGDTVIYNTVTYSEILKIIGKLK